MVSAGIIYIMTLILLQKFNHVMPNDSPPCGPKERLCAEEGRCIPRTFECDGQRDCQDGSDETTDLCLHRSCSMSLDFLNGNLPSFTANQFRCAYGACISPQFTCDGIDNCFDGSDETPQLCRSKKCRRRKFQCDYGGCIRKTQVCNGKANCHDESDESAKLCSSHFCGRNYFKCKYGACIFHRKKCDGRKDCLDGSDEDPSVCGGSPSANFDLSTSNPTTANIPTTIATSTSTKTTPSTTTEKPTTPKTTTLKSTTETTTTQKPTTLNPTTPKSTTQKPTTSNPTTPKTTTKKPTSTTKPTSKIRECNVFSKKGISYSILHCGGSSTDNTILDKNFMRMNSRSNCVSESTVPQGTIFIVDCWSKVKRLSFCTADGRWRDLEKTEKNSMVPRRDICQSDDVNDQICGHLASPKTTRAVHQFSWPSLVEVNSSSLMSTCVGTIIARSWVLAEGSCIRSLQPSNSPSTLSVSHKIRKKINVKTTVKSIYTNNVGTTSGGLALLHLEDPFLYNEELMPACVHVKQSLPNRFSLTIFIGKTSRQWKRLIHSKNETCNHLNCKAPIIQNGNHICISNSKISSGISTGDPYFINDGNDGRERWSIVGFLLHKNNISNNCPQRNDYVYTSIAPYASWINGCIRKSNCA